MLFLQTMTKQEKKSKIGRPKGSLNRIQEPLNCTIWLQYEEVRYHELRAKYGKKRVDAVIRRALDAMEV